MLTVYGIGKRNKLREAKNNPGKKNVCYSKSVNTPIR